MKVEKVVSKEHKKEFTEFSARLFSDDSNYIRPIDKDIESVFDTKRNKFFRFGECERFLFLNDKNKTVGKIAVFINKKYEQDQPTGGIGFFDCINDQETANFIFDFAKDRLQGKGMEAMDGPINFGERDRFWGLLIEGFSEPLFGMNYNPPYYKELFENYGFQIYFNQLCFGRKIHDPVAENFLEMHERISKVKPISAKRMKAKNLEKFAVDFTEVYNKAWANHGEGKQLTNAQTLKLFLTLKPVINDHISWFIYENEKPIAMWMNIPDLNQWFKYLDGKFGLWQKLKFLFVKKFRKNKKMVGLVFGIVPEWQKKGIDGFMIWEGTRHFRKTTDFEDYEMQWIGDFNPKMMKIAENLETEVTRKLATYRYLFDREKEFERHPIL
ncbi:hypothetical protein [Kaistella jeonii]|uniref:N-acetyltransferase domain-containing protein n=1 Tax=Kaistella jeonii TaxID=266749 RepID=A0A0C1F9L8_9FLAO|nr:hypothetical protein [Kaistella jeonii]KIA89837.1 hypothetical protein OA86_04230 [Kaistella jeonii]SFB85270.1 hypothetical protein SAMN05421876_10340 [Kaistella jeonii]VEI96074.1 Uncharacterised protein [Kaistella jeonii]